MGVDLEYKDQIYEKRLLYYIVPCTSMYSTTVSSKRTTRSHMTFFLSKEKCVIRNIFYEKMARVLGHKVTLRMHESQVGEHMHGL